MTWDQHMKKLAAAEAQLAEGKVMQDAIGVIFCAVKKHRN